MKSPTPTASLTVKKMLPCSPEVAFKAWTTPALFQQWFQPKSGMRVMADFDLRLGGKYRIGFCKPIGEEKMHVIGEFTRIEPPHRVEYTWVWHYPETPDQDNHTLVKVAFNGLPDNRTEVVLTHENFTDPSDREGHTEGWTAILDCMAEAMAKG